MGLLQNVVWERPPLIEPLGDAGFIERVGIIALANSVVRLSLVLCED